MRIGFPALERCRERFYVSNTVRCSQKLQSALKPSVENDLMLMVKVHARLDSLYVAWLTIGEQIKIGIPSEALLI
jgi:hypothetical protein